MELEPEGRQSISTCTLFTTTLFWPLRKRALENGLPRNREVEEGCDAEGVWWEDRILLSSFLMVRVEHYR